MDDTYIKVKGVWKYLYRAVDKEGKTVDFLLTAMRDRALPALRFFEKAMKASDVPEKVTMDNSGANKAAMDEINDRGEMPIIVEQGHRAIKRITRPMFNFKSFRAAKNVLAGIELMHMIRKSQLMIKDCNEGSFAEQFYALAGQIRPA